MSSEALPAQGPIHSSAMPRARLQRQQRPGQSLGSVAKGVVGQEEKGEGGERKTRGGEREKGERVTQKERGKGEEARKIKREEEEDNKGREKEKEK